MPTSQLAQAREVFLLFVIPVGGGIPAGVLVGKNHGLSWILMTVLYFFSDILLACVFEPLMIGVIAAAKYSPRLTLWVEAMRESTRRSASRFGVSPGPLMLILISFGVDPMTGRSAARAAGHGFIAGWMIAIAGDMVFFWIIMASTLWLNGILGNGTWTAVIILLAMFLLPYLIGRWRHRRN